MQRHLTPHPKDSKRQSEFIQRYRQKPASEAAAPPTDPNPPTKDNDVITPVPALRSVRIASGDDVTAHEEDPLLDNESPPEVNFNHVEEVITCL